MFLFLFFFCLISYSYCDNLNGEIDLRSEKNFNTSKYDPKHFLSPLPFNTLRLGSYKIRQQNPFSSSIFIRNPDMAYTKSYLHKKGFDGVKGLIQFRQISDMWLTEIKGVVENLEPNSSYFLVINENFYHSNKDCENLGLPLNFGQAFNYNPTDLRTRNNVGDLGFFYSDDQGVGFVNLQSSYTSLFGGPSNIIGRSVTVHKAVDNFLDLTPLYCGDIKMPTFNVAQYQKDPHAPLTKKVSIPTTTSTETPDFDKPPSY